MGLTIVAMNIIGLLKNQHMTMKLEIECETELNKSKRYIPERPRRYLPISSLVAIHLALVGHDSTKRFER